MHLLTITNFDYGLMTLLFGLLAVVAYSFRRKNNSSLNFLLATKLPLPGTVIFLASTSIGLLEFGLCTSLGAYAGLSVALLLTISMGLIFMLAPRLLARGSLLKQVSATVAPTCNQQAALFNYGLWLVLVASLTLAFVVDLFRSLLGWEFANSALAIMTIIGVCLLLGGVAAACFNQMVAQLVASVILVLVLVLAYRQLGVGQLIPHLQQVAIANDLAATSFSQWLPYTWSWQQWLIVGLALFSLLLTRPLALLVPQLRVISSAQALTSIVAHGVPVLLLLGCGVLALATPSKQVEIAGKRIVTQQTRLNDGSLGFVVRAVPTTSKPLPTRGLIPARATADEVSLSSTTKTALRYDYLSAGLILVQHVTTYAFVPLFMIVVLFFKTLSDCLLGAASLLICGIYAPKYNKSGEELENLWAARVLLFTLIIITISLGLVIYHFFSLYAAASVVMLLAIPVLAMVIGLELPWWGTIGLLLSCLIGFALTKVEGIPNLYPVWLPKDLVQFSSYAGIVLSGLTLGLTMLRRK